MIADDFRIVAKEVAPVVRPVPLGYAAWVRETSGGSLDLEIERLRRAGVI